MIEPDQTDAAPEVGRAGFFSGWRGLRRFWGIVALVLVIGAGILQRLGPPPHPGATAQNLAEHAAGGTDRAGGAAATGPRTPEAAETRTTASSGAVQPASGEASTTPGEPAPAPAPPSAPAGQRNDAAAHAGKSEPARSEKPAAVDAAELPANERPGRSTPGPVPDPDPALLEASPASPSAMLPRIALDGRMPMQVYAAGFDHGTMRARVGLIVAGFGLSEADSLNAARSLPGGVTFAVPPYAVDPRRALSTARFAGHEYLLSLPMEPREFPLNDPGDHALMTSLAPEQNMERLTWALSRIAGYVGVTGASGGMRGERFAGMTDQMEMVMRALRQRGLLYVDPIPGQARPPLVWSRSIDLVIDEPPNYAEIEAKLNRLSTLARDRGSALGLATAPRPVTVERIAAWTNRLMAAGLILAPVTALAQPPEATEASK